MNLMKKIIAACTAMMGIAVAAPVIWDGTADDSWYEESAQAYNLTTAEQLAGLAKLVNEGKSSFEGKTITLGADIFLNDTAGATAGTWASIPRTTWTPIGSEKYPFKGEFDGLAGPNKKRKIYGLYFNDSTSSYVGLFGYTSAVKISNLDLLVGRVTAKNDVGALVGRSVEGTVTNVHAEIKVSGVNHVGGLVGYTTGSLARVSVTENIVGQDSVGGVVGFATGSILGTVKSNCYFEGKLNGRNWVGGIAGRSIGGIQYAYHQGGDIVGISRVGGISGETAGNMKSVFSEGSVQGNGDYVGGIVGYCGAAEKDGVIDSAYHTKGSVSSTRYVGGVAGWARFVNNSYKEGSVAGTGSYVGGVVGYLQHDVNFSHHVGDVSGEGFVGGLVGSAIIIRYSYAEGDVIGTANYVGGLAGEQRETAYRLIGSYAKGNVFAENSNYVGGVVGYANSKIDSMVYHIGGDVIGHDYVGGVVGYSYGLVDSAYHKGSSVSGNSYVGGVAGYVRGKLYNSYAVGNISSTAFRVGGVAGQALAVVDSCYHIGDVKAVSQSTGATAYDVGGLVGRSETSVSNSYAEGNVVTSGPSGYSAVGGVVGYTYRGTISNCYHVKGSVTSSSFGVGGVVGITDGDGVNSSYHEGGEIRGLDRVGGVAGYIAGSISNSYSDANVTGTSEKIGGVVGALRGSATKCFSTGIVKGVDYVGGAIGLVDGPVSGVYATKSVEGRNYVGGLIGKATEKTNASYFEGPSVKGENFVGGLIGAANDGNTCCNDNDISGSYAKTDVEGTSYVGGLVGQIDSRITQSNAEGKIFATGNKVGGIVGYTSRGVDNSFSICEIMGQDSVGGIAGYAGGAVSDVHAIGNLSGRHYLGGIVGYANGTIRNAYSVGNVFGQNTVGGVAGYAASTIDLANATGDSVTGIFQVGGLAGVSKGVVDSSYSTSFVMGDDNIGGLVGSSYANITSSYALGNVQGDVQHSSQGNDNLGGLIGYAYSGLVSKSMALGRVSGTTKLGGLVGRFEGTSISQSYAGGSVFGSYYGDAGNYYIGGLVGFGSGTIEETYASGRVKGIEENPFMTGCLIGSVSSTMKILKSYYDSTTCKLGLEGSDPETEETLAEVTGSPDKTTAEMQNQETFEEWDFANTWKIMDDTYPFLQIYGNSLTNAVVETETLEGIYYDGTEKTPLVTSVKLFGETLSWETEYTITYKNNVNAGMASINICGVQPYGGCKVIDFEIIGIAVEPTIATIENMTYTGRALTPEIEVYNGETLLSTSDYTLEFKNNINAGIATATVTMVGNYRGSVSKTFVIEKATPLITKAPKASDIVLGQTLAASELSGGFASTEGEFVWEKSTTAPTLENEGYAVVFVPADTVNYTNSVEVVVPIKVLDLVYAVVHAGNVTLDSVTIAKGSSYTLPAVPDSMGYDFVGLYNGKIIVGKPGEKITVSENMLIVATYKPQLFVITFMMGSTELKSDQEAYGTIPMAPTVPLPENTAQYTYSFEGWDKEIVAVTEAVTYNAVIDSVVNKYQVVFKDYDGTVLKDSLYAYGTLGSEIVMPTDTIRASTAQYTYTFTGWGQSIASVTGDAVYTAQYDSIVNVYEVAFVVPNDTLQSVKMNLAYGAVPAYEGSPTKDATMQYSYTFVGWFPEIESVSGTATYTAVFDSSVRAYTITFVNGSTPLQSDDVAYGTLPEYSGATPIKEATAQYTYTFKSWNPTIVDVTAAATYAAVFDSVVNKYMITFKLGADILQRDSVAYGTLPIAPTVTLPENTAKYTYSVAWNKEVVSVTGSATYTAIIDSILNKYEVVFKDYDGSVLKDSLYAYGTAVKKIVKPANPKRETTAMCTYTFKGWTPEISSVTEDVVYTAEYDSTIRSYTVAFVNGSTKLQSGKLLYGSTPEYNGNMPTKKSNAQYTYTFKGWNPEISSVTGAVTYTAIFDSTLKEYVVTFLNGKTKLQTGNVAYGSMPVYLGDVPTKAPTDSTTYKFVGWEPELATVSGKASYVAKFETVKKTFMVRFMNKFMLDMQVVSYGETPVYTGAVPTKEADEFYSYSFIGWSPEIGPVTRETDYVALFDSTDLSGIADFRLANLEMSVNVVSRNIQISAAPIGSAYAVLDMQGRVLRKGRVESANFNVSMPESGHYLVRVGEKTKRVSIK